MAAPFGLAVSNLSPSQLREHGTSCGVFVEDVSGSADRAGLRRGDVIELINDADASNAESFTELLANLDPRKTVTLLVRRDNLSRYVLLKL
jgi:serine protease Do